MHPSRAILLAAPLIALAACDLTGSGDDPLHIEGAVVSSVTGQPVAGATVSIEFISILNESLGELPDRKADGQGRFTARVDRIRGYARPNCAVVWIEASAPGYSSRGSRLSGPPGDMACGSGRATTTIALSPLE